MSDKILPNCVGRLDPIVEAIREGKKDAAFAMLFAEQARLKQKSDAIVDENRKAVDAWEKLSDFVQKIHEDPAAWENVRRECGWSEQNDEKPPWCPPVTNARCFLPKLLDAATLPIGTVMVLGGSKWELTQTRLDYHQFRCAEEKCWWNLLTPELQELIDRGVEFRLPEGGA